jgi:hypothetical protein
MTNKKSFGLLLCVFGAVMFLFFLLLFDTTVLVDDGSYSVNNFGLMQDRQTGLIVSALIFVSGIFLILSGSKEEERMQSQISNNSPQNVVAAKFKGNKDLNNDSYKLYLVDEFNINKNPVLDKFSCNDKAFDSLELALKYAHDIDLNRPKISVHVIRQSWILGFKSYSLFINGVETGAPLLMDDSRVIEVGVGDIILQAKTNVGMGSSLVPIAEPLRVSLGVGQALNITISRNFKTGKVDLNLV